MSRTTIFLLFAFAASISLTIGKYSENLLPVPGSDLQCRQRGYYGACFDFLPEQNWIINPGKCSQLKCAKYKDTRPHLVPVSIGPALNGTRCGDSKICRGGSCVTVKEEEIPMRKGSAEKWYCSTSQPHVVI